MPHYNILYGVPSEGMGHATRSKEMIKYLMSKGHTVKCATSDRAADFLGKAGIDIYPIKGLHLTYENGKVSKFDSLCMNLKPEMLKTNVSQFVSLKDEFHVDLVITDYDSFTYFYAKAHKIPILSLDNIQFCARYALEVEIPKSIESDYSMAKNLTKMKVPGCDRYLVYSAWSGKATEPETFKIAPMLRQIILDATPSVGDHVLVYQTSTSQDNMIPELQKVADTHFLVYGFNREEEHGNVHLKKFSEDGFVQDLASSKAVVTNGGHSLISEAIYLHKPLCCFPIAGQFEQWLNAAYVQKLGYGETHADFSGENVKQFMSNIKDYQSTVSKYTQNGNNQAYSAVECFIQDFAPTPETDSTKHRMKDKAKNLFKH
mmetsp:Transcript_137330/g.238859  ORF Transcript_137330/g.238859 Transcript_137330/m.238859 type:complete len:374 (-) Transcript_137330:868-1989(-)